MDPAQNANPDQVSKVETTVTAKPNDQGIPQVTKTTTKVIREKRSDPPPLINLKVTNPVVYIKAWWKKLIGNEGIKLTIQIKPLTAVTLTLIVSSIGFGLGRITLPPPLIEYIPVLQPPIATPTPNPWRETAFTGKLQLSGTRYYLLTNASEAIYLEVPENINLKSLIGKRIMAVGNYHKDNRTLLVTDATDLEVLPSNPIPIPTTAPTTIPSPAASL
jgi:hypothetical protein